MDHVTTQCQNHGKFLEEAQWNLGAFGGADRAESEIHDLVEKFEREKQALNDEISRLRERNKRGREERSEGSRLPEFGSGRAFANMPLGRSDRISRHHPVSVPRATHGGEMRPRRAQEGTLQSGA